MPLPVIADVADAADAGGLPADAVAATIAAPATDAADATTATDAAPTTDAATAGLPTDVCHAGCGARQLRLWARFERGGGLDLAALPKVYAGVCYVLGAGINPQRAHHVGFLFSQAGAARALNMRFSFFTPAQPYAEFDAAAARAHFGAPTLPLSASAAYAYAEADSRSFLAQYWFRREAESERVLLVGYFGARVIILCDAGENG
ncbi:MAG: hypothetical protein OD918_11785 [Gammaproteobacteria bacterium]